MSLSGLCFSLALLFASFSKGLFAVSLLLLIMAGWGIVSFLATANSFIQLSTTDNLRGRVMSVYSFVFLRLYADRELPHGHNVRAHRDHKHRCGGIAGMPCGCVNLFFEALAERNLILLIY